MNKDEVLKHIIADLQEKKAFYEVNKEYGTAAGIAIAVEVVRRAADEDIH